MVALLGLANLPRTAGEFAAQLAALEPHEVPQLPEPRPGTPFADVPVMPANEALKTIAAFRLALPKTILRFAGGREITLGDLGTKDGLPRWHQRVSHRGQLPDHLGSTCHQRPSLADRIEDARQGHCQTRFRALRT